MSGYGRGEAEGESVRVGVEVRSVNHRFCRVALHMPAEVAFFEAAANQLIRERVERGKVDVTITVTGPRGIPEVQVNRRLAESYRHVLQELGGELGISGDLDMALLVNLPGVLVAQAAPQLDPEHHLPVAESALRQALDALDAMRTLEGGHLAADLARRFRRITTSVEQIEQIAARLPQRYREQLHARIAALCEGFDEEIDPARLAQEVAYYADRSDITEELVRLHSHLRKAEQLLSTNGGVGRSLEFLLQELHREINTIGSKAKATEVSDIVVNLKSELERIREQVQNIE
ncbi:MAG: YicC/YloC family endoribonuclease [Acidobacteriota bacterium]